VVNIIVSYGANTVIRNLLFFRKKKEGGSHIRNIIIGAGTTKRTPYGTKVTEKIQLLGRYYYRGNFVKRKPSYYHRGNVIGGSKGSIIIKGRRTGRTPQGKYYHRKNVVKRNP